MCNTDKVRRHLEEFNATRQASILEEFNATRQASSGADARQ